MVTMKPFSLCKTLRAALFCSIALLISACEINGGKRDIKNDDSIIISYFFSDQYAIESEFYQKKLSLFWGAMAAADKTGNLRLWKAPPSGCYFTNSFIPIADGNIGIKRRLDVGELKLSFADTSFPLAQTKDNFYFTQTSLVPGSYSLKSPGLNNGVLKYNQVFSVLPKEANIQIYNFENSSAPPQSMASPEVPAEDDRIIFNRFTTSIIAHEAPEGTDYIRLRLTDGSNTAEGDITCFAKPAEALTVPNGALYSFRTTEQGFMEVDFVKIFSVTDIPRVSDSTVISTMRHFQGLVEYKDENGVKITNNVGIIEFR